jgi:chorismate--pyruvate lyase
MSYQKRLNSWCHYQHVPAWVVPRKYRPWVLDQGSLTKRLIKASNGDFSVRVTLQGFAFPSYDEQIALNIPSRQRALIREVELVCFGQVWVRARSVIPVSTLTGAEKQLMYLGSKPLGALLFKSRVMRRSDLEVTARQAQVNQKLYGRRSVFFLHNKPLLVSEIFMPCLFDHRE